MGSSECSEEEGWERQGHRIGYIDMGSMTRRREEEMERRSKRIQTRRRLCWDGCLITPDNAAGVMGSVCPARAARTERSLTSASFNDNLLHPCSRVRTTLTPSHVTAATVEPRRPPTRAAKPFLARRRAPGRAGPRPAEGLLHHSQSITVAPGVPSLGLMLMLRETRLVKGGVVDQRLQGVRGAGAGRKARRRRGPPGA